jgi:hypothetical protein
MKPIQITDPTSLHSAAHVLAAATLKIFPNSMVGIGPVHRNKFYYDFSDLDKKTVNDSLSAIQAECDAIIEENLPINQLHLDKETAQTFLLQQGQLLKAELLQLINEPTASFFSIGKRFTDLCRGPHLTTTKDIGFILLTNVEEVYWNNDISRPKMIRIYGILFHSREDRDIYSQNLFKHHNNNIFSYSKKNLLFAKNSMNKFIISELGFESINNMSKTFNSILQDVLHKNVINITLPEFMYEQSNTIIQNINYYIKSSESISDISNTNLRINQYINFSIKKKLFAIQAQFITNIFKILSLPKENLTVDLTSANFDETITKLFVQQVQLAGLNLQKISVAQHNYIVSLKLFFRNSISEDIKILEIFITDQPDQYILVNITLDLLALLKQITELNKGNLTSLTRFTDIVIIPISYKSLDYCENLRKTLLNKDFRVTLLSKNKSLMYNIILADTLHPKVTCVVGTKETRVGGVSTRVNKKNLGMIKISDLEEYINSI